VAVACNGRPDEASCIWLMQCSGSQPLHDHCRSYGRLSGYGVEELYISFGKDEVIVGKTLNSVAIVDRNVLQSASSLSSLYHNA
jgi:hypothetical protein